MTRPIWLRWIGKILSISFESFLKKNSPQVVEKSKSPRQAVMVGSMQLPLTLIPIPFNMGRATATPRLYAVVPKNSPKGSQIKATVNRRRSGCLSSNSDVERGDPDPIRGG